MQTEPDILTRVTIALDDLARAMESGEPDVVLAAEAPIATAVSTLRTSDLQALARNPEIRTAVLNARLAVARCRTLGHASLLMSTVVASTGYGRSGRRQPPRAGAANVTART